MFDKAVKERAFGFLREFEGVTGQRARDWSSFEELEERMREQNPAGAEINADPLDYADARQILKAMDETVTGEIQRVVTDTDFSALYIRQLAELLVRIREAMV